MGENGASHLANRVLRGIIRACVRPPHPSLELCRILLNLRFPHNDLLICHDDFCSVNIGSGSGSSIGKSSPEYIRRKISKLFEKNYFPKHNIIKSHAQCNVMLFHRPINFISGQYIDTKKSICLAENKRTWPGKYFWSKLFRIPLLRPRDQWFDALYDIKNILTHSTEYREA